MSEFNRDATAPEDVDFLDRVVYSGWTPSERLYETRCFLGLLRIMGIRSADVHDYSGFFGRVVSRYWSNKRYDS